MNSTDADPGLAPLRQLTLSRLREFFRQPEAVFWVYFFPILMVVALGIAFRDKPVEKFKVDVVHSNRAETLFESLATDARIISGRYDQPTCELRLRTGKSDLFLVAEDDGSVSYHFDETRPGSAVARGTTDGILQTAAGRVNPLLTRDTKVVETGGRYIDFLVPGLLGMGLMGGGLWGVGFAVVDMRIRKLLKRFLATPMKRTHFLMSIMISRLFFMIPEIILLLWFSWFFFGVRIYGSPLAIITLIILGAIEFSGVGLLVASRAKTIETVSGLMNLVMLPLWTLSGIFFAYDRFPESVQPFIRWLPLTPLIDSLRGVMLSGNSLGSHWYELSIMAVWSVVTFVVALRIFRWTE
jgi:ABC-type multidrug transport system permease subunit